MPLKKDPSSLPLQWLKEPCSLRVARLGKFFDFFSLFICILEKIGVNWISVEKIGKITQIYVAILRNRQLPC